MIRICRQYRRYIKQEVDVISDECLNRKGVYQDQEIGEHFWNRRGEPMARCKHCEGRIRCAREEGGPVITKNWPKDKNGRWLNYWHIIDKDIILR